MKRPSRIRSAAILVIGSAGVRAADLCAPMGWATRVGRTAEPFEVTGGGNATPIIVTDFATLKKYAADSLPRVLYIDGTMGAGWRGSTGDRLEIRTPNKTIVGIRPSTRLEAAINISAANVILRNILIEGPGSDLNAAWNNLTIEGAAKNIWIDHCEFWDGEDGNANVRKGADNVTFTWNIFGYKKKGIHNFSNLIGSSDNEPISEGKLNLTFMFNWWSSASARQPRVRYGNVHVVNNLYTADTSVLNSSLDTSYAFGVANGFNARVRTENNHFVGILNPIDTTKTAGSSAQETIVNLFENCTGNQAGTGTSFTPPYEYKSFMVDASKVDDLIRSHAGATLPTPASCTAPPVFLPTRANHATEGLIATNGRFLTLEGLDGESGEIEIVSVSGTKRCRRTFSPSSGRIVPVRDLHLEPGIHLATARTSRHRTFPAKIQIFR